MADQIISSKNNPLIKKAAALKRRKERQSSGLFLLEGVRILEEALTKAEIEYMLFTLRLTAAGRGKELIARALAKGVPCYPIAENLLQVICSTEHPQGVVGVVKRKDYSLESIISQPECFLLFADQVQDPGNLGTIMRTASAVGATGIILSPGTVDPYNEKTIRSTMGAILSIPILEGIKVEEFLDQARCNQVKVVAGDLEGKKPHFHTNLSGKICIAVGNEAGGISPELRAGADELVTIPLKCNVESLNVAVAAAILLYEKIRQDYVGATANS
ncbi:MAG: TrmH family RNA methyltransferase [Bacillota bacterium]